MNNLDAAQLLIDKMSEQIIELHGKLTAHQIALKLVLSALPEPKGALIKETLSEIAALPATDDTPLGLRFAAARKAEAEEIAKN